MKMMLVPLTLVLVVAGLIFGGAIKIPGMGGKPQAKKDAKPKMADEAKMDATPAAQTVKEPAKPVPTPEAVAPAPSKAAAKVSKPEVKPTIDPAKGDQKLAGIFNEMDADKIAEIVDKWQDDDLAKVLSAMDNAKVVEVLGKMKPERSSALVKDIQKLSSIVAPAAAS